VSKTARVLVLDDDPLVRRSCQRILETICDVTTADSGLDGLRAMEGGSVDIALVDLKLPDMDGMDVLRRAPEAFPDVPIIVITGHSGIRSAVEAVKLGASDYLAKPFDPDELEAAVRKALRESRLRRDYRRLQEEMGSRYHLSHMVAGSPVMQGVLRLIEQVAPTDTTVLLTGESGTGKELAARAIQFSGRRKDGPFVAVDCGAVAPSLIASELFGHVRGAFSGAVADQEGLVRAASGGTLFLDEISSLSLDLQATLLRVIETRQVRAVGTSQSVEVDVRFIAATNRNLHVMVEEGKFREDLFYRLNVFPIHLPPLRDRREDIPPMAGHFLSLFAARMHKPNLEFTDEAIEALMQYDWPGNVRELSNVVERLVILSGGTRIGQANLPESMTVGAAAETAPRTAEELNELKKKLRDQAVAQAERSFLIEALRRNGYNVTKAAEQTGMQRSNFQALLAKYGLRIRDIASREDGRE